MKKSSNLVSQVLNGFNSALKLDMMNKICQDPFSVKY